MKRYVPLSILGLSLLTLVGGGCTSKQKSILDMSTKKPPEAQADMVVDAALNDSDAEDWIQTEEGVDAEVVTNDSAEINAYNVTSYELP